MLPYGKQWIDDEDIAAVAEVLRGDFVTQGPNIELFEQYIAEYTGARYAVAFCNGTAALHGACHAAGIGPGDEVITSPITFLASSNCVLYQGGKPVFGDIDPLTYNLDPAKAADKLTRSTKAIIPVDYTGQPADMRSFMKLAQSNGLVVIEDAAHSLGATYHGHKVGTLADMTMFSFHPVKHVTTGEGGIIVTDNEDYYRKMMLFRNHGMTKDPGEMIDNHGPWYYEMQTLGFNYRMTDMQAALGLSQMRKLDNFLERRRKIVSLYNHAFSEMSGVEIPYQAPGTESAWHLYMLKLVPGQLKATRKEVFEALRAENIGVHVHYIPVHLQPYYRRLGYRSGEYPIAESLYECLLTIPLFPLMTDEDVHDVIVAVNKVLEHYRV
jgi:UDP-4-amino-4,6-dideoxy-N-acetyl-beta-L-altrosamine transaminase